MPVGGITGGDGVIWLIGLCADLGLCMLSLVQQGSSESVTNNVYSGILTFSSNFGDVDLSRNDLLSDVRKYIKKVAVKKGAQRDPLLYHDLEKIYYNTDWSDYISIRDTVMCVISWHGLKHYQGKGRRLAS